jgi:hypothetical protein
MSKYRRPKLQPLRLSAGWKVTFNQLYEVDPPEDSEAEERFYFTEDLLLLSNQRQRVLIDVSWRPEISPKGRFYLSAINWVGDGDMPTEWSKPLMQFVSRSRLRTVERLERWAGEDTDWSAIKRKRKPQAKRPLKERYPKSQALYDQEGD